MRPDKRHGTYQPISKDALGAVELGLKRLRQFEGQFWLQEKNECNSESPFWFSFPKYAIPPSSLLIASDRVLSTSAVTMVIKTLMST